MAKRGRPPKPPPIGLNGLGPADQTVLANLVKRLDALHEERAEFLADIGADIREVMAEVKRANFDAATVRRIVRERAMDQTKRQRSDDYLDTYRHALGMLADTPLGRSALERDGTKVKRKRRPKAAAPSAAEANPAEANQVEASATELESGAQLDIETAAEQPPSAEQLAGEAVDGMRALRASEAP